MESIEFYEIPNSDKKQRYYLKVQDRTFYIGDLVGKIIECLINGMSVNDTLEEINNSDKFDNIKLSKDDLEKIINDKIKPLNVFEEEKGNFTRITTYFSGIFAKKTILTFDLMKPLISVYKYIFNPYIFYPLLLILVAINFYYMRELIGRYDIVKETHVNQEVECIRYFSFVLIFYPLLFVILLLHEIGHASASYFFKVKPKTIGFGFYFIFPVLFTDVTDIWRLGRWNRIIVNLSGIFTQLLVNAFLILWIYNLRNFDAIEVIRYLMILNIFSMYINIIPFIKFDGYWIYSDLFKLPNLMHQTNAFWAVILKKIVPSVKIRVSDNIKKIFNPNNIFLIVYFIGRQLFLIYIVYRIYIITIDAIKSLWFIVYNFIYETLDVDVCTLKNLFTSVLVLSIFTFFTIYYYSNTSKKIRQYMKNRQSHK